MEECRWNLPRTREYAVEILKRFRMMDCKAMTTPMASNLKLLSVASSELVDATIYCQMIGSLIYLMNTRPYISFVPGKFDLHYATPPYLENNASC